MAAVSTDFQPSPAQRRLLDFIHEHPSLKTIHELCAAAGIGRTTYYRWCQSPGFRIWLATAWSARLLLDGTVLLNVARVQATRSYPYWKALFDLTFRGGRAALPTGKIGAKGCEIPQGQKRLWRFCAPGKRIRRGPCEAQRRLGAPGPQAGVSTSGTRGPSRAGARANHGRAALPAGKIGAKGCEPGPQSRNGFGVVVIPQGQKRQWPPGSECGAAPRAVKQAGRAAHRPGAATVGPGSRAGALYL